MIDDRDELSVRVGLFSSWCISVVVSGRYACCPRSAEGGTVLIP